MSAAMAFCAACLISAGAGKSGKPCERLTAPCLRASRVISRMTDSVNCAALAESCGLVFAAGWGCAGFIRLSSVDSAINVRIARDDFDVFARLSERNRVDEFGGIAITLASAPGFDVIFPAVVSTERGFDAAELFQQIRDVNRSEVDIVIRIEKLRLRIANVGLLGHQARCLGDKLHQAEC